MTEQRRPSADRPDLTSLTAISPLDGRYRGDVADLAPFASEMGLIQTRIEIESKYLIVLSSVGLVRPLSSEERTMLVQMGPSLSLDQAERVKEIEDTTRHDVKAMERVMREIVDGTSLEDVTEMIHFGLTSEDVNNLAYRLMLDRARISLIIPALDQVVDSLVDGAEKYKAVPMLGRTHGQPAVPTTLGKELANYAVRLNRQTRKAEEVELTGKLDGAIGNFNAHTLAAPEIDWIEFSKNFVESLGLKPNLFTTQINPYEDVIELFQAIQRANGVVLDLDQDIWRYISDDWFTQEVKKGEVGSSTMPQKVNPIRFENSEGNLAIANSLLEGMGRKLSTSRLQRDLSDSTTIRNIGVALGHGLLAYRNTSGGLARIHPKIEVINASLNENWNILGEGVQTVLRRAGVDDPYSLIADLSRGKNIGPEQWVEWVKGLPVEDEVKDTIRELTPESYVGKAIELTDLALFEIRESKR